MVQVDKDFDSLLSSSTNLFFGFGELIQTTYLFLWRLMEYIWTTLVISQQYEKLLVDTHFSTQHFGNSQDTISQTFLELEQTLPMCFPFCKSGSASLLKKMSDTSGVSGWRPSSCSWLKIELHISVSVDGDLTMLMSYTGNQGQQCRLEHEAAAERRVFSWHCRKTVSSLIDRFMLCQVSASPFFSLCNSCAYVKCQSGINQDGTALGFMAVLSDLLDEF